jgi:uncharacterized protein YyaL (SSP411 family)
VFGLLELFQADGDPAWLEWARALQQRQDELFWDEVSGGWFGTTGQDASVLLRMKEDYDGAEPAASSIGVLNLMTLAHLTGDDSLASRIELTLRMFAPRAAQSGRTVPMAMAALSTYHAGMPQIVLAAADERTAQPLRAVVRSRYLPTAVVVPIVEAHRAELARVLPWTAAMTLRDGSPTAYVCREFACLEPTIDGERLAEQLDTMGTA